MSDVRRIQVDRKAAVNLCGHGPYREPRPVDLQFFRILRYADALSDKLGVLFEGRRQYVDLNYPWARHRDDLPALDALCDAVAAKRYDVVFIDIAPANNPNQPHIASAVGHFLRPSSRAIGRASDRRSNFE
jgi:hypothetical protein